MQSFRRLSALSSVRRINCTRPFSTGGDKEDSKQSDDRSRSSLEALRKIFGSEPVESKAADFPKEWAKYITDDRLPHEKPGGGDIMSMRSTAAPIPERLRDFQEGDIYQPDDLNWMKKSKFLEHDTNERLNPRKGNNAVHFRAANQDPLELALNPDLLRLFISPTGRIQPRRFTGLTAKEQRKLEHAIKRSRQLALLPFCSRYPEPSHDQLLLLADEASAGFDYRDFEKLDEEPEEPESI